MTYIQVNIGRNIDNVPMGSLDFDSMRCEVAGAIIDAVCYDVTVSPEHWNELMAEVEYHNGYGYWDGVREESMHISTFVPSELTDEGTDWLRARLRRIADSYGQDAVALIIGSELI